MLDEIGVYNSIKSYGRVSEPEKSYLGKTYRSPYMVLFMWSYISLSDLDEPQL